VKAGIKDGMKVWLVHKNVIKLSYFESRKSKKRV